MAVGAPPDNHRLQVVYSHDDLKAMNLLSNPIWVFDIVNKSMWWGNTIALKFWNAETLEEFINRNYADDMSETMEKKNNDSLERIKRNEIWDESWTFYPNGCKPKSSMLKLSGIKVDQGGVSNGHLCLLVEAFPVEANKGETQFLRAASMLRYLPMAVSQFDADGKLMYQNPEACRVFGSLGDHVSEEQADDSSSDPMTSGNASPKQSSLQHPAPTTSGGDQGSHESHAIESSTGPQQSQKGINNPKEVGDNPSHHDDSTHGELILQQQIQVESEDQGTGSHEGIGIENLRVAQQNGQNTRHPEGDDDDDLSYQKKNTLDGSFLQSQTPAACGDQGTGSSSRSNETNDIENISGPQQNGQSTRSPKGDDDNPNHHEEKKKDSSFIQRRSPAVRGDQVNHKSHDIERSNRSHTEEDISNPSAASDEQKHHVEIKQDDIDNPSNHFLNRFVDRQVGIELFNEIKSGKDISLEALVKTKDGPVWNAIHARLAKDVESEDPIIICSARDISDIVNAKKQAQLHSERAEFFAIMAHEIRTPLFQVTGFIDLLNETELSNEQRDYVKLLRTSAASLMAVINDILDYSKLEAGKMKLDIVPFEPRAVVDGSLAAVAPLIERKGLCLNSSFATGIPVRLMGDPNRLRQILLNLLNNAVKFTPQGTIEASVELIDRKTLGRVCLKFSITDTGIGIDPENLSDIFRQYNQAAPAIGSTYGGTGLGLSICNSLVSIMGGSIGVDSAIGKGSTFWVTIPFDCPSIHFLSLLANRRMILITNHGISIFSLPRTME